MGRERTVARRPAEASTWAHQLHLQTGNRLGAVRCAFWLVFRLLNAGDLPSASGWIARIERLLGDAAGDLPERGHLTYLTGFLAVLSGDLPTAEADLGRSVQIAERGGDLELSTLARLALGRVLIFRGDVSGGVRLLDEAMVAVNAGEVSPVVVGDSYCAAIDACHDVFDVRRGQIWTPCTTQRQFASVQQSRPRYGQQPEPALRTPARSQKCHVPHT